MLCFATLYLVSDEQPALQQTILGLIRRCWVFLGCLRLKEARFHWLVMIVDPSKVYSGFTWLGIIMVD